MDPLTAGLLSAGGSVLSSIIGGLFGLGSKPDVPKPPSVPISGAGFNIPAPAPTPQPQPVEIPKSAVDAGVQRYLDSNPASSVKFQFTPDEIEELYYTGYGSILTPQELQVLKGRGF